MGQSAAEDSLRAGGGKLGIRVASRDQKKAAMADVSFGWPPVEDPAAVSKAGPSRLSPPPGVADPGRSSSSTKRQPSSIRQPTSLLNKLAGRIGDGGGVTGVCGQRFPDRRSRFLHFEENPAAKPSPPAGKACSSHSGAGPRRLHQSKRMWRRYPIDGFSSSWTPLLGGCGLV